MTTTTHLITADELLAMGDVGPCELVRGEIIHMAPAGAEHGDIGAELLVRITIHVRKHRLGKVYNADTGFIIGRDPDTVRAPDVGFVRKERLPPGRIRGFFPGAPDLAVEIVSPFDRLSEMAAKVDDWLAAGTASVWVVDPSNRNIVVYHSGKTMTRFASGDELRDEDVLPGFALKLNELFETCD
jgi:Uma2 family endonuclease